MIIYRYLSVFFYVNFQATEVKAVPLWQSQPDPSLKGAQQLQSITGAGPLHPREALQSAFQAQKNRRQ